MRVVTSRRTRAVVSLPPFTSLRGLSIPLYLVESGEFVPSVPVPFSFALQTNSVVWYCLFSMIICVWICVCVCLCAVLWVVSMLRLAQLSDVLGVYISMVSTLVLHYLFQTFPLFHPNILAYKTPYTFAITIHKSWYQSFALHMLCTVAWLIHQNQSDATCRKGSFQNIFP